MVPGEVSRATGLLPPSVHIAELSKKIMGILMFINRVSDFFDKPTRIVIVQSLVLSLINYCITIWGSTNKTLIQSIQKLQNFAAKTSVGGARKYDHVTPIMKELKWLTIKDKYLFEKCFTVYKKLNNIYPDWYLHFPTVRDNRTGNTRQQDKLFVPRARTDSGARASNIQAPKLWNELPSCVTSSGSPATFKHQLNKYFTNC